MTQLKYCAVLTGDIIRSSRLRRGQLESVRLSLTGAVDVVRGWKRGLVKGKLEFFRGDTWQLLLADPAMALRAGILLRAALLSGGLADSRIAIGLGKAGQDLRAAGFPVDGTSVHRFGPRVGPDDAVLAPDGRDSRIVRPVVRLAARRRSSLRFPHRPMDRASGRNCLRGSRSGGARLSNGCAIVAAGHLETGRGQGTQRGRLARDTGGRSPVRENTLEDGAAVQERPST